MGYFQQSTLDKQVFLGHFSRLFISKFLKYNVTLNFYTILKHVYQFSNGFFRQFSSTSTIFNSFQFFDQVVLLLCFFSVLIVCFSCSHALVFVFVLCVCAFSGAFSLLQTVLQKCTFSLMQTVLQKGVFSWWWWWCGIIYNS